MTEEEIDTTEGLAERRPSARPEVPRVFDWCQPWHKDHSGCPGSYVRKGRPRVVCGCPTCNHEGS